MGLHLIDGVLVVGDVAGQFIALDPVSGRRLGAKLTLKANVAPTAAPLPFGPGRAFVPLTDGTIMILPLEKLRYSGTKMRTFGLIPAAGKSRDDGSLAKLPLPLGDKRCSSKCCWRAHGASMRPLLSSLPDAAVLAELATASGAHVVQLTEDTPDMRATCLWASPGLRRIFIPRKTTAGCFCPRIIRRLGPTSCAALLDAAQDDSGHSIIVPTYKVVAAIRPGCVGRTSRRSAPSAEQGLNVFIRGAVRRRIAVGFGRDLRDLDTPEDYVRLVSSGAWRR